MLHKSISKITKQNFFPYLIRSLQNKIFIRNIHNNYLKSLIFVELSTRLSETQINCIKLKHHLVFIKRRIKVIDEHKVVRKKYVKKTQKNISNLITHSSDL